MRRKALNQGVVLSKHIGGIVPDNTKGKVDGVRQRIAVKGKIPVGKNLDRDFFLAIKQPGMVFYSLATAPSEAVPLLRYRAQPSGHHSLGWQHTVEKERQEPNCA